MLETLCWTRAKSNNNHDLNELRLFIHAYPFRTVEISSCIHIQQDMIDTTVIWIKKILEILNNKIINKKKNLKDAY